MALTQGELYTVVTNKAAQGKKGALVAMIQGTKASAIAAVLLKIPFERRMLVTEVTLDMADSMDAAIRAVFPNAVRVTDRFHVQQLVSEAVQEIRLTLRRAAIQEENEARKCSRAEEQPYLPPVFENGDTKKQLLARSRYLLFKPKNTWNEQQNERAGILFKEYPKMEEAYNLAMMFRHGYEQSESQEEAKEYFAQWYEKVREKGWEEFLTAAESIQWHEETILNYFTHRSTNAGAESFNAKLKNFRAIVRGVRDKKFHLFRVAKLYG